MIMNLRMTRRGWCPVAFFIVATSVSTLGKSVFADAPSTTLQAFRGMTMGTTYMVKVSGIPEDRDWYEDTAIAIDAELRQVNDQMSTYLKSSELSQFNDSDSTNWFDVSRDTAEVVQLAMQISNQSGGMLDVTVGPLVNRWSFGPGDRKQDIPSEDELTDLKKVVGHRFLEVRMNPPAIKKQIPNLRVDLSAIAKGHGVDRLVELLLGRDVESMFVEIGGEVRVTGQKQTPNGLQAWKVGIQQPNTASNQLALAQPMQDSAMATSGDYRNFFEVDGKRFSHTINPVTGCPIEHDLASVTVIAPTCAEADGWATALNAAGPDLGLRFASENAIDSLLITRNESVKLVDGKPLESFQAIGTGMFIEVAERMNRSGVFAQAADRTTGFAEQMMPVLVLTAIGFAIVVIAMAVGVMFGRKAISGSCGGLNATTDADGTTRCSMCSTPSDGCQELRDKIAAEASRQT
jgi:thiamine biosynthesis lipoprotein